ncbi:IclR family transcriptional regulator [Cellulosimicrobium sp. 22601]|uniref:IclR family transcriptional regulator n=1 Tax=unclassified Cellulosimicrobium TaxID=2624466 RepID=UPI003F84F548
MVHDEGLVDRVVVILDALATRSGSMRLSALAEKTGLPKATLHRILGQLSKRGAVERTADGYALGPGPARWGTAATRRRTEARFAAPRLYELWCSTHLPSWLAGVWDQHVVLLGGPYGLSGPYGWPDLDDDRELASTAVGRLVLAHQPARAASIAEDSPRRWASGVLLHSPRSFDRLLERVAGSGFATEQGEHSPGWSCVAAPVFSGDSLTAVVGVTGPVGRVDLRRTVPRTTAVALAITRDLARASTSREPQMLGSGSREPSRSMR